MIKNVTVKLTAKSLI